MIGFRGPHDWFPWNWNCVYIPVNGSGPRDKKRKITLCTSSFQHIPIIGEMTELPRPLLADCTSNHYHCRRRKREEPQKKSCYEKIVLKIYSLNDFFFWFRKLILKFILKIFFWKFYPIIKNIFYNLFINLKNVL